MKFSHLLFALFLSCLAFSCNQKSPQEKAVGRMCDCLKGIESKEELKDLGKEKQKEMQTCIKEAQKKTREELNISEDMSQEKKKEMQKELKKAAKNSECYSLLKQLPGFN